MSKVQHHNPGVQGSGALEEYLDAREHPEPDKPDDLGLQPGSRAVPST